MARLLIGNVTAGSFLYNCRDQKKNSGFTYCIGVGHWHWQWAHWGPLLALVPEPAASSLSWSDDTVKQPRAWGYNGVCMPYTTASSTMTSRQLRNLSLTPIYANSTTPCPNLGWPAQVKVGMGVGPYASPNHEAFRRHIKSSSG
jgi:hypothetical protein